jgi:hypothetical protein
MVIGGAELYIFVVPVVACAAGDDTPRVALAAGVPAAVLVVMAVGREALDVVANASFLSPPPHAAATSAPTSISAANLITILPVRIRHTISEPRADDEALPGRIGSKKCDP